MTSSAPSLAQTVGELLSQRTKATPSAPAFQVELAPNTWQALTWHDFTARVQSLRQGLAAAGLRRGQRLAVVAPASLEWELLHHAALSMGVALVGLDAHDLPERIASMAWQAGVTAVACQNAQALAGMAPDQLAGLDFVVQLGQSTPDFPAGLKLLSWDELVQGQSPAAPALDSAQADDVATIIFTSGTTGAPKGIAYTHRQLCLAIDEIGKVFAFVPPDGHLLCWLPLSNLFQRMVNLAGVRNGVVTYLLADPRRVMDVVAQVSPDVFVGVPRVLEKLHEGILKRVEQLPRPVRMAVNASWQLGRICSQRRMHNQPVPPALELARRLTDWLVLRRVRSILGTRVRCLVTGSAPAGKALLEEFHALGWLVLEAYGLSENVMPMAMNRIDAFRFGTVGHVLPGNEIILAANGVIKVRGHGVFNGYLSEAHPDSIAADGFYTTGDLGEFDPDGFLRLTGRVSELLKTSTGKRIAPAGAEAQLRRVPGIDQALLVGDGRKYPVALCTCTPDGLSGDKLISLKAALKARCGEITPNDRPRAIALLDGAFTIEGGELTPNLKLRRESIINKHAGLIDALYSASDGASPPLGCMLLLNQPH